MQELLKISAMNGAMSRLLMVFLCRPGGLRLAQLMDSSGVRDPKSARLALRALERAGVLVGSGRGAHGLHTWELAGRLRLVDGRLDWEAGLPEGKSPRRDIAYAQPGENPSTNAPEPAPQEGKSPSSPRGAAIRGGPEAAQQGKSPRKGLQAGENPRPESSAAESKESEFKDSDSKESESLSCEFSEPAGTDGQRNRLFLEHSGLLFGRRVLWNAAFAAVPESELLGWLAQAWQGRCDGKLQRPWGFVYQGLLGKLRQKQPDPDFRTRPWERLPEEYLSVCGLESAAPPEPSEPCPPEQPAQPVEPDDSQAGPFADFPERRVARAWQAVIDSLEREIGIYTLRLALIDSRPLAWDESAGRLTIAAASPEAAEWLESRLAQTTLRRLRPVLDRWDVSLVFTSGESP